MASMKKAIKEALWTLPSSAVLMIHHCVENPSIKLSMVLKEDRFKKLFENRNLFCGLPEIMENPGNKKVAVTFDDGLLDVYCVAYPFLKSLSIPFTIFIAPDLLGMPGYITVEQLREMSADDLVTVGSHCLSHEKMPSLSPEQQEKELTESKKTLQKLTKQNIDFVAYPFGQNDKITRMIARREYSFGFVAGGLPVNGVTLLRKTRIGRYNVSDSNFENVLKMLKKHF